MKRISTFACSTLLTLPLILPVAACTLTSDRSADTSAPVALAASRVPGQGHVQSQAPNQVHGTDVPATHQRIAVVRFARAQALARAAARAGAATLATPAKKASHPTLAPAAASAASAGGIRGLIKQAFGSYAVQATRVAMCESGLNPYARNATGASGVFQVLPSTWARTPYHASSPFNAWANINAAHWLFVRDGYSWREWQCAAT